MATRCVKQDGGKVKHASGQKARKGNMLCMRFGDHFSKGKHHAELESDTFGARFAHNGTQLSQFQNSKFECFPGCFLKHPTPKDQNLEHHLHE
jgi:NOL1/NOP2/fmu family ribosome biogenesis protein